jgi:hypothetical protein
MKPERWRRIEELYHGALERDRSEWSRFLDEATAGDEDLRQEVASLLTVDDQTETFLETTALGEVACSITGSRSIVERQQDVLSLLFSIGDDESDLVPELRATTPQGHVRSVRLEGRRLSLGRAETNDLAFPEDDGLSRRHIVFESEDDQWSVIDLGSKNGTYVNGARITGKHHLQPGDQITASCVTIHFTKALDLKN